jgi:Spy/CpxP family protein refolding chaperone
VSVRFARRTFLTALLAVALAPQQGEAQADRAQLEERVRAQMARVMRERLGLTEEQATRLSEVTQSYENQRRELFNQEQAARRRVEAVLLEGLNDQDEARELISRMGELREREASLFRAEQDALLDVLTPVQVLRLQELRQDFGRRIRALGGPDGDRGRGVGPGARSGRTGGGAQQRRGSGAPGGGAGI